MAGLWSIPFVQLFAAAVLLVTFLGYMYLTYHYGKWPGLGVPHAAPSPPFGSLRDVIMGRVPLVDTIHSLYHRFDGQRYFGIYEGRQPLLVIRDPQLVHTIMVKDFRSFVDRNASKVSFVHDKLFDHLVNLRGEQWKAIRAKLSPTFSATKLKSMLGDINVCTVRLVDNLNGQMTKNSGIVDVSEASAQFTTDTIGRCAFGLDCNTLSDPDSEFRRTGRDIFAPRLRSTLLNITRLLGFGQLLDVFRIRGMPANIYNFFDNLLETTMEQHKYGENTRNDFIALLVKLKDEEKLNIYAGIVDVSEASAQFTTDTIGRCAFGLDCNTLSDPDSEFRRTGRDIFAPRLRSTLLNITRLLGFGQLLDVFRIRGMPANIYNFFDNLLETTMEQHKYGENTRNDFIALLVKLKDEEKLKEHEQKLFTDDILAANAFVFFVAGFETTASTISYCLYELAMNPEIQTKLRDNIKQTLNANDGKLSYDTLKDMKYLDMVINETFRLHPPVPVLNRACTQKYTIEDSNITLNVGEKIIIPTYSLHRDPKYYSDPEIFDPERFTEENISSRPHGTFLPFGDGPRICIGMRFAMMEAKTGLAEILLKFEVSPCKETQTPIKIRPRSILLTPNESIRLLFKSVGQ